MVLANQTVEIEARSRFAQIITNLRSGRDLRSFARLLGVSHPTVLAWERCESIPKRENLQRVAAMRGESLDELLTYLKASEEISPEDRLLTVIHGASKEQLIALLRAITDRLERI